MSVQTTQNRIYRITFVRTRTHRFRDGSEQTLTAPTAFRVGDGHPDATLDHIPADTLFSGICVAWRELFGTRHLEDFLHCFPRIVPRGAAATVENSSATPPVYLSSCFPALSPMKRHTELQFFFPAPVWLPPESKETTPGPQLIARLKALKTVKYLSYRHLRWWLTTPEASERELIREIDQIRDAAGDMEQLLNMAAHQFARVSPAGGDAEPFTLAFNHPQAKGDDSTVSFCTPSFFGNAVPVLASRKFVLSYYVMARIQDTFVTPFEDAFCRLGEKGIGGRKSSGNGGFEWERCDRLGLHHIDRFNRPGLNYLLAPYFPDPGLVPVDDLIAYRLAEKGGFSENAMVRDRLRFIDAGSIVRWNEASFSGLVELARKGLPHPIYRFSAPLTIALGEKNGMAMPDIIID